MKRTCGIALHAIPLMLNKKQESFDGRLDMSLGLIGEGIELRFTDYEADVPKCIPRRQRRNEMYRVNNFLPIDLAIFLVIFKTHLAHLRKDVLLP